MQYDNLVISRTKTLCKESLFLYKEFGLSGTFFLHEFNFKKKFFVKEIFNKSFVSDWLLNHLSNKAKKNLIIGNFSFFIEELNELFLEGKFQNSLLLDSIEKTDEIIKLIEQNVSGLLGIRLNNLVFRSCFSKVVYNYYESIKTHLENGIIKDNCVPNANIYNDLYSRFYNYTLGYHVKNLIKRNYRESYLKKLGTTYDDLSQEVSKKLINCIDSGVLKPIMGWSAFVSKIAECTLVDFYKKEMKQQEKHKRYKEEKESDIKKQEESIKVINALDSLPRDARKFLVLHFCENKSTRKLSKEFSISCYKLGLTYEKALKDLKKILEED